MDSILGSDTICQQTLENSTKEIDNMPPELLALTHVSVWTYQSNFSKRLFVSSRNDFLSSPTWQGKVPQEQEREKATATLEEEKVEPNIFKIHNNIGLL